MPKLSQDSLVPNGAPLVRDMTEDTSRMSSDSKRSVGKKEALAATGIALGASAIGTAAAQEDGDVVVFGEDYVPGAGFEVAAQADESTKNDVFQTAGLDEEFDDPDDWDLYLITVDVSGSASPPGFLMTEDSDVDSGDTGTMDEDATMRNPELNLVEFTP